MILMEVYSKFKQLRISEKTNKYMLEDINDNQNILSLGYKPSEAKEFTLKHIRNLAKSLLTKKYKTKLTTVYHLSDGIV